jgi:translation elongation factor EF-4
MVFAGIYPVEADDYTSLRESLDKYNSTMLH